jgi:hypothetical protein
MDKKQGIKKQNKSMPVEFNRPFPLANHTSHSSPYIISVIHQGGPDWQDMPLCIKEMKYLH